jgi:hypothetical protein
MTRQSCVTEPRKDQLMLRRDYGRRYKNAAANGDATDFAGTGSSTYDNSNLTVFRENTGSFIYNPAPVRIRMDSYVVSDQFFFFNSNGTVTATI